MKMLTPVLFCVAMLLFSSCNFLSSRGEVLFTKGKYTIAKKNLISYYLASPDLFVKTPAGGVKINLNPYSKQRIPQEKISSVDISEVNEDSIIILFKTNDTAYHLQTQTIYLNVKYATDSILHSKTDQSF